MPPRTVRRKPSAKSAAPALSFAWPDIKLNDLIAGTIVVLMNIQIGGAIGAAATLLLIVSYMALNFNTVKTMAVMYWALLLLPAMAMASMVWSHDPISSLRYGFQLALTCAVGVMMALVMSPRRFILVTWAATLIFCIASIASGLKGASFTHSVLIGLTGSKNQMSFVGSALAILSFAVLFLGTNLYTKAIAVFGLAVGAYVVAVTESLTGVLTTCGGIAVYFGVITFIKAARPVQVLMGFGLFLIALTAVASIPLFASQWDYILINVFHKDATLTGRTYLWAQADYSISQHPFFGVGYKAYWTEGSADAMGITRQLGLDRFMQFGFQDTYREVAVDLGLVGLAIFVMTCIVSMYKLTRRVLQIKSTALVLILTLALVFMIRSLTDMSVEPFLICTMQLYSCFVYAWMNHPVTHHQQARTRVVRKLRSRPTPRSRTAITGPQLPAPRPPPLAPRRRPSDGAPKKPTRTRRPLDK